MHSMNKRIPPWLTVKAPKHPHLSEMTRFLRERGLNTVCEGARCPNIGECFARKTATFMILGETCTRNCGFCGVSKGGVLPPDPGEPARVGRAAKELELRHVVVTSVTRDDLPDGGAAHFANTIRELKAAQPSAVIEVLVPDFQGNPGDIACVLEAGPHIFNHNVETVPRLYATVRPQAVFERSLEVLRVAKDSHPGVYTKSGIMLGLGETEGEVRQTFRALREARCDILTVGQYLQPARDRLPVVEYVPPEVFDRLGEEARAMGFLFVASGPFVRSSYNADAFSEQHPIH